MTKVLVVYCSMSGNTRAAAEVVAAGAKGAGARVTPKEGSQARPQDPLECDAAAPGSHDAFSYMGGALKDFLDRAFYPTQGHVTDKPYAAFVTHGGEGKEGKSIESLAQVFKLKRIAPTVSVQGEPARQAIADLEELGVTLAAATRTWGNPPRLVSHRPHADDSLGVAS